MKDSFEEYPIKENKADVKQQIPHVLTYMPKLKAYVNAGRVKWGVPKAQKDREAGAGESMAHATEDN